MIRRVIVPCLFLMFVLALVLSLAGVTREMFNNGISSYIKAVSVKFNEFSSLEIPTIPTFDTTFDGAWYSILIDIMKFIANLFVGACNLAISVTNFINKLFTFVITCITAIFSITDYMQPLVA